MCRTTGGEFMGTIVGGLSALTYDKYNHVFYLLSDDMVAGQQR
jgi:hypothetical protein